MAAGASRMALASPTRVPSIGSEGRTMAQKDYLLRMIEMVGEMLARLRKMLLGGETGPEEAEGALREVAGRAGLDLPFLRSVSHDTLVMLMSPAGEPEPGRTWMIAELFLVDGTRAEAAGDPEGALDRYQRALRLYGLLDPGIVARGFPEVAERIREVTDRLAALEEADV